MNVKDLHESEWIESVESHTQYEWSDIEYWKVTTVEGAYNEQEGVKFLCSLNIVWDMGNELLIRKGNIER